MINSARDGITKPTIVLVASILMAIGMIYWGLAFNRGYIEISSEQTPFSISGLLDETVTCEQRSCNYEIKPKVYNLSIEANGFTRETVTTTAKRNRTTYVAYTPTELPKIEPAENRSGEFAELIYMQNNTNGDTEIWLRDTISDQKLTTFSGDQPSKIYYDPSNPIALIETTSSEIVELNLIEKRKEQINLPRPWQSWKLLGKNWIGWSEDENYFFSEFSSKPNTKLDLSVNSLDHVITTNDSLALLISQQQLGSSNNIDDDLISGLLDGGVSVDKILGSDNPYYLYNLNLETAEFKFLQELEWTSENAIAFERWYDTKTLESRIYLTVDGKAYSIK